MAATALLDNGPLRQVIWENTYRTEPEEVRRRQFSWCWVLARHRRRLTAASSRTYTQEAKWQQHRVQAVLKDLLQERLVGQAYDPVRISQMTKQLAGVWHWVVGRVGVEGGSLLWLGSCRLPTPFSLCLLSQPSHLFSIQSNHPNRRHPRARQGAGL